MSKPRRRGRPKLRTPKKALTIRLPVPEYKRLAEMAKTGGASIGGLASAMLSQRLGGMVARRIEVRKRYSDGIYELRVDDVPVAFSQVMTFVSDGNPKIADGSDPLDEWRQA